MSDSTEQKDLGQTLVPLCIPQSEVEAVLLSSLLRSEHIFHLVHNDFFGSLMVGPVIELYNAKTILVRKGDLQTAREVIEPAIRPEEGLCDHRYTVLEMIRMAAEVFLIGWIVPRPRTTGLKHRKS